MTKEEFVNTDWRELSKMFNGEFDKVGYFDEKIIKEKLGEDWEFYSNARYDEWKERLYDILAKHRPEGFI